MLFGYFSAQREKKQHKNTHERNERKEKNSREIQKRKREKINREKLRICREKYLVVQQYTSQKNAWKERYYGTIVVLTCTTRKTSCLP